MSTLPEDSSIQEPGKASQPRMSSQHRLSLTILLFGMAVVMLPFLTHRQIRGDEFTLLSDALRQARGAVMYRDFFEFITPLSEWPAAIAFHIFGPSVQLARTMQGVVLLIAGTQLFQLARRTGCGPWVSTLPAWMLLLVLFRAWPVYSHHWLVLPFLLGALQAGFRAADEGSSRWWAIAGACSTLAFLTIQLDGLAIWVALAFAIPLVGLASGRMGAVGHHLLGLLAGALLPLTLVASYFAFQHGLMQAWYDTWVWPFSHYKTPGNENDVAWGSDWRQTILPVSQLPGWLGRAYYFGTLYALAPLSLLVGAGWALCTWLRQRPWNAEQIRLGIVLWVAGVLAVAVMRGKCDLTHVAMYGAPFALLAIAFAERFRARFGGSWLRFGPHGLLILMVVSGGLLQWRLIEADRGAWFQAGGPDAFFRANPVVRYLREHSQPSDRILVMPLGGFYYFYARPPATPYTLIEPPGNHYMTPPQYAAVWQSIRTRRPKFVVFSMLGGESALAKAMLHPLTGYRRVLELRPEEGPVFPAYVFERLSEPVCP